MADLKDKNVTAPEAEAAIGTAADGYVYTFSFSTDFPTDFDYADFARVFAQRVTVRS